MADLFRVGGVVFDFLDSWLLRNDTATASGEGTVLSMGVYVDDMAASFRRMIMCHMVADSTEELLAMADMIGVDRKWIQHAGTQREHFDIAKGKRALAVRFGAKEINAREMGYLLLRKRGEI